MTKKAAKAKSPDKLAQTGKKSGVELGTAQLDKATGGLRAGVDGESTTIKHPG